MIPDWNSCERLGPFWKVIWCSGISSSPFGQEEEELGWAWVVRRTASCFGGYPQPDVGALAPGYPAKKFYKLRFSWTMTTTCLI